jgi:hypothetical protein
MRREEVSNRPVNVEHRATHRRVKPRAPTATIARTYDLRRFDVEKRHALNAWAAYLLSVVEPAPDKVTQLRKVK